MGFSYFSIFSQFGSEMCIIKEIEVGPARLQFCSNINIKTLEIKTFSRFGLVQEIPQFLHLVLTKTEFYHENLDLANPLA